MGLKMSLYAVTDGAVMIDVFPDRAEAVARAEAHNAAMGHTDGQSAEVWLIVLRPLSTDLLCRLVRHAGYARGAIRVWPEESDPETHFPA